MSLLTDTDIQGWEVLQRAYQRPAGQGLITVSNHAAALDDPLLLAALMPADSLLQPAAHRWGMCATDRCFKSSLMSSFFRAGKVCPLPDATSNDSRSTLYQHPATPHFLIFHQGFQHSMLAWYWSDRLKRSGMT